jgi:hypothetical protein
MVSSRPLHYLADFSLHSRTDSSHERRVGKWLELRIASALPWLNPYLSERP